MQTGLHFYHLSFLSGGTLINIKAKDVLYMTSRDKYVKVVTASQSYLVKSTITILEQGLFPDYFCRVHRSFIVCLFNIDIIDGERIILRDHEVPLSRSYKANLFSRLNIINP